jgi:UDP-N-acetylmuramoylalanine--D-glutamate ligase
MTLEQLAKQGRRTATMTTAATITSKISQIRKESIRQAFGDLDNVKYRYEYVDVIDGVTYYDDSAACTTDATWFSFDNVHQPMIWITYANNNDCEDLIPQVKKYVKAIICIGNDNEKFHKVYDSILKDNVMDCTSLEKAVRMASLMAGSGDSVMLSPATHNNADYSSYMDRGDDFKQFVHSLK